MSIQYIKGVGPKRKEKLNKMNIFTVEDLINYYPRDYEDRSSFKELAYAIDGEKSSFKLRVSGYPQKMRTRNNLNILKLPVADDTARGFLTWFNQNYMANGLKVNDELLVNGKVSRKGSNIEITSPTIDREMGKKVGEIVPIYSLTSGLTNNELVKLMDNALNSHGHKIEEFLPDYIMKDLNLLDLKSSIRNIHFPENRDLFFRARNRLVFQELLLLQLGLFMMKTGLDHDLVGLLHKNRQLTEDFIESLPFKLTGAQNRVFKEIEADMESHKKMNRLVQGDVGSGKTIVAILAMLKAYDSGYQSAMMAPTEILAQQHYESIKAYLSQREDIRVELLVGSLKEREKEEILKSLKDGEVDIIVGTHALIQEAVEFKKLGLAVTDEQHRFGVKQRNNLSSKGESPDVLVMTATPIPRTLALILYGDLDISIIDELPPGRQTIDTYAIGPSMIDRLNVFIKKQIDQGRQAYIVAPLIEDNENLNLKSAESIYMNFKDYIFKDYRIGLLHGSMKAKDKDEVMEAFKNHELDILVSTTVIEVGVDVPNSNIIAIYNAERFGLAQLHQLRGRVGRGKHKSYCILINEGKNEIAIERMKILQASQDGFLISEKDLELRGPGEFFGTRQHGLPDLKIANLFRDMDILKVAQNYAKAIIDRDKNLELREHLALKKEVEKLFGLRNEELILN